MTNDLKWMLASDFQIPYQDKRATELWFKVMDWFKPDVIDYLGDISDQMCFSSFNEGTTTEFLKLLPDDTRIEDYIDYLKFQEKTTADFYAETRKMMPDAEMFSALGNHDIRIWKYAEKKLQETIMKITPESLWGLDSLGIAYAHYDEIPTHRYGDIYVHHGVSALSESGASVKSDMGNWGTSLIRGHSHRMSAYFKTYELRNEILRGYEIGHMCQVDSEGFKYSQMHNWQQGFMVGHIESGVSGTEDGYWPHLQLIQISPNYTCYIDGHKFAA